MSLVSYPRLVIAGCSGDSGKTLATLGALRAWRRQSKPVQAFKKGPDYIDPAWLTMASGRPTRNLDSFLMGSEKVARTFCKHAIREGLNIIEGNRGLHDGENSAGTHSTAVLAKLLDAPVILMLPVVKMTRSAAAVVLGMKMLDPEVTISGVILNQVAGSRHEKLIRDAVEDLTGIPVLGAIPKLNDTPLVARHLGLVTPTEHRFAEDAIEQAANLIEQYVDLSRLEQTARQATPLEYEEEGTVVVANAVGDNAIQIGWFTGTAFTFYYPENLEALTEAGARLVPIDPLTDTDLPDIDALYIGGGFPETHGTKLMDNAALKSKIREASADGLPIWAECGGLMYLAHGIHWGGQFYEMAGVLPVDVEVEKKPQGHGYAEMICEAPNVFFPEGTRLKGHEFHYSRIINARSRKSIFQMQRGSGIGDKRDGLTVNNTVAVYTHLHATASPEWAPGIINAAKDYHQKKR